MQSFIQLYIECMGKEVLVVYKINNKTIIIIIITIQMRETLNWKMYLNVILLFLLILYVNYMGKGEVLFVNNNNGNYYYYYSQ